MTFEQEVKLALISIVLTILMMVGSLGVTVVVVKALLFAGVL